MTVRLVVNFILAGLAVAALVFDKNKYDKILGALLLAKRLAELFGRKR